MLCHAPHLPARACREQMVYKVSAIAATVGVTSLAIVATWLRFSWHLQTDGEVPWVEMAATLTLVAGGMVSLMTGAGRSCRLMTWLCEETRVCALALGCVCGRRSWEGFVASDACWADRFERLGSLRAACV